MRFLQKPRQLIVLPLYCALLTMTLGAGSEPVPGLSDPDAATPGVAGGSSFVLGAASQTEVAWVTDLRLAREQARVLRRPILVDFWARWCHFCLEMDRRTFRDGQVIQASRAVTMARIDADRERQLMAQMGVSGLPTLVLLDRHGRFVNRLAGFRSAPQLLDSLSRLRASGGQREARRAAVLRAPTDPGRLYALADAYLAEGSPERARQLLQRLTMGGNLAGSELEPDATIDLAIARAGLGQLEGAVEALEHYLAQQPAGPRVAEANLWLGSFLLRLRRTVAALAPLQRVLDLAPESWKAREAQRLLGLAKSFSG